MKFKKKSKWFDAIVREPSPHNDGSRTPLLYENLGCDLDVEIPVK